MLVADDGLALVRFENAALAQNVAVVGMRVGDRFLHVAPLFHAAELCIMLMPGTMVGARHVVLNGFDPAVVADTMESERITMFFGVPTLFQFLLKVPDLAERDLSAWRTGLYGAAPMPASAGEQLVSTFTQVDFMQLCGQTEGGPAASTATQRRSENASTRAGDKHCRSPNASSSTRPATTSEPATLAR